MSADGFHTGDNLDPLIWKVAAVAMFGTLLSQLDATIVNVSLSSLATELHTSLSVIQWVTSGYLLALTLILPLTGWVVDRVGAKTLYLWCFSAFTVSSVLCGLAWSASSLIVFRILQGLSGGLLAPMAQMMIARVAGKHMARVIGYISVPILLAPVLGPIIAGSVLQYASWRWLFLINLPVGALALVLAVLFLPNDSGEARRRSFDWVGMVLLSPGLVLLLYGAERNSDNSGRGALLASAALLAVFVATSVRKGDRALLDLCLFKGRTFSSAAMTQFLSNGVSFAGQMLISIFLIQACGRSTTEMGWLFAPMGLGMMGTSLAIGALTTRFGIRPIAAVGALLSLAGTLPFLVFAGSGLDLFEMVPALFLRGMGMAAVMLPSMSAAYASVARHDLPMATTTLNVVQRLGGPILTTLCATVLAWSLGFQHVGQTATEPYIWPFFFLCALHALQCLSALRLPRWLVDTEHGRRA